MHGMVFLERGLRQWDHLSKVDHSRQWGRIQENSWLNGRKALTQAERTRLGHC